MLFEDGSHTSASSDSSHKTQSRHTLHRSTASNWSNRSHTLATTNIHKLFSEKIEIFGPVQFSKVSILTGVIKISLKVNFGLPVMIQYIQTRVISKVSYTIKKKIKTH